MGGLMASAAGALSNCAEARGSRAPAGRGGGGQRCGQAQHGRVADFAGRAAGAVVVVVAVSRAARAVVLARCRGAGCVVDGGLGGRAIMVGVGIGGCQVLGLHNGCGMIEDTAVVVAHAFRHRLMRPRVLRRACGQQRRHNARRHGRAGQASEDQHHHQQEEKTTTHISMMQRGGPRFRR